MQKLIALAHPTTGENALMIVMLVGLSFSFILMKCMGRQETGYDDNFNPL